MRKMIRHMKTYENNVRKYENEKEIDEELDEKNVPSNVYLC